MSTVVSNKMASSLPGSEGFASVPLTKKASGTQAWFQRDQLAGQSVVKSILLAS
jgi:hypothetical protein